MTAIEKIRTSFSIRLSLWVVGFVLVIFVAGAGEFGIAYR